MNVAILGATGTIGRALVDAARASGHVITAQSRTAAAALPAGVAVIAANPLDAEALGPVVEGQDAVIDAIGFRRSSEVTFFSRTTKALLGAMHAHGVRRLIAITGVGAGDTCGHGGWLYDHIIFPLFTRALYADKDRQEALIRESDAEWTILRPAPFTVKPGAEPFHALTAVRPRTRLSRVTPKEVAAFTLDCAEKGQHLREVVFFGHGEAG